MYSDSVSITTNDDNQGSSLIQLNLNLRISPIYSTYNLYVINYKSIIYVAKNQDV